jgi:anti-sigma factor RsiW
MSDHLSTAILNALADGELSSDQLASADEHLAGCPACTSWALFQTMLKSATAKAGQRYAPPPHLWERIARQSQQETSQLKASSFRILSASTSRHAGRFFMPGWAIAMALLLISVSVVFIQRSVQQSRIASSQLAALVTEVSDQHIATLAANSPPQVLSSDRHTVKPWFQGKLPFSFNLPEGPAE